MNTIQKIAALRTLMNQHGLAAYIVPGTDPHASEYMASHWAEATWLSGFTGEACTLVVTTDRALLWTDSRYYLQAGIELKGTGIELMRESDIDCPSVIAWLSENVQGLVGVNPEMFSVDGYNELKKDLQVCSIDLVATLWTEGRPEIPMTPLYEYEERYAGESVASKLQRVRKEIRAKKADAMVISALDEIAWLLNIRGFDVDYNPVVIAYCILEQEKVTLFVNSRKVDAKAKAYFERIGVQMAEYEAVFETLKKIDGTVLYDSAKVNERLYESIAGKSVAAKSPILIMKSHKNPVELDGERRAMIQDSVALTRFFMWLEQQDIEKGGLTEWDLMEKLHSFRAMGEHFVEESFGTIAGYRGNGAIVHYAATAENCATIAGDGMLLLDSGGQYLDGTTDITRCVWLGDNIPAEAKRDYTLTLKGHLALGHARWPRGTRGNQLDALAKQYMWAAGITFGHGTGHGVGHFLGCHEGPQNVRTDMNPTVLEAGQICSDEPGIYRTDKWGVRIENLVAVTPIAQTAETTTEDEWLTWETLTLCYYDRRLMEMSMLTSKEITWLNDYHQRVYELTAPHLNAAEAAWLADKCKVL